MTPFSKTFIIKGYANNGRIPSSCPFHASMTSFPDIAFINEEDTGCINEDVRDAINEPAIAAIIPAHSVLRTSPYGLILVDTFWTMIY